MKLVAISVLLALLVSIPFAVSRRKPALARSMGRNSGEVPPDDNNLYDTEDFIM